MIHRIKWKPKGKRGADGTIILVEVSAVLVYTEAW